MVNNPWMRCEEEEQVFLCVRFGSSLDILPPYTLFFFVLFFHFIS